MKSLQGESQMQMTKEQFNILKYFKEGLNCKDIEEKLGIRLYTNDPRVISLYEKYNVLDRIELCKKAELDNIQIID